MLLLRQIHQVTDVGDRRGWPTRVTDSGDRRRVIDTGDRRVIDMSQDGGVGDAIPYSLKYCDISKLQTDEEPRGPGSGPGPGDRGGYITA